MCSTASKHEATADMPTVLSIQSWVACGNVGNTAALFPLQLLGCETWSLNTVAFSNHTGYGKWRGTAVPAHEIAALFEGIAELGILPRCDAVLSGYLGEAEAGPVLLDIVARVKQANPRALFTCDPVMGDVGPGWYVRAGIPEFYRDRPPDRQPGGGGGRRGRAAGKRPRHRSRHELRGRARPRRGACGGTRRRLGGGNAAAADRSDRLRRCGCSTVSRLAAQRRNAAGSLLQDDRRDLRRRRSDDAEREQRIGADCGATRTRLTQSLCLSAAIEHVTNRDRGLENAFQSSRRRGCQEIVSRREEQPQCDRAWFETRPAGAPQHEVAF